MGRKWAGVQLGLRKGTQLLVEGAGMQGMLVGMESRVWLEEGGVRGNGVEAL